jgi:hypothetical protein
MESKRETNGLKGFKPKDGRVRFDGAANGRATKSKP